MKEQTEPQNKTYSNSNSLTRKSEHIQLPKLRPVPHQCITAIAPEP